MVYELAFKHDGKDHYLAGRKQVHDGTGVDIWTDTTTLFTALHQGLDPKTPDIGAGILRSDMADFLRLLSNVKATGSNAATPSTDTVAKFGTVFRGPSWGTFIHTTHTTK